MRIFQATTLFFVFGQLLATPSAAKQYDSPAIKDSTIMRSTVSCPDCPDRNCYKCTLGHDDKLTVNTGGLAYNRALIGFHMPVDGSQVTSCTVQVPAFVTPLQSSLNVTVNTANPSDWNEDTVDGENAPDAGDQIAFVTVPSYNNLGPIDITPACQGAVNGEFSVYFGAQFGYYQLWSENSGNPAILHITTK
ncbi:hypothetical protein GGI25_004370 [Coemansia spiralis]|uniref:Carbohydrate-binding module family 96 domain-containing protein n=2 Tax=Coemansia TaxID=4863 RepID=A0A9W8G6P6_9FUNG|nr:hypothetical protein BX070DRAFT_134170 [Coemansia spiralis]KAJ1995323.1 hypothetical protein EDC05_000874 [Coemansia umbellata]KAJ2674350.1 hypothetical protein GGI25_004370 [Coemansia spiralis]